MWIVLGFIVLALGLRQETHAVCMYKTVGNLRKGQGKTFEKTWQVHRYTPLKKVARKGPWMKVHDVDGDTHWILANLVTDKFKCVTVRKPEAHLFEGPSIKSKKVQSFPVIHYSSFKFLQTNKDATWVQVEDTSGVKFWILHSKVWIN